MVVSEPGLRRRRLRRTGGAGIELSGDEQNESRHDANQSATKHFHIENSDFYRSLSEQGRLASLGASRNGSVLFQGDFG
jgi:hypothetical protein